MSLSWFSRLAWCCSQVTHGMFTNVGIENIVLAITSCAASCCRFYTFLREPLHILPTCTPIPSTLTPLHTPLLTPLHIPFLHPYLHPYLHPLHTPLHIPYTHPTHTLHTPYTHPTHTTHTPYTHPIHTLHTPYTHQV